MPTPAPACRDAGPRTKNGPRTRNGPGTKNEGRRTKMFYSANRQPADQFCICSRSHQRSAAPQSLKSRRPTGWSLTNQTTDAPSARGAISAWHDISARCIRHITVGWSYTSGVCVSATSADVANGIPEGNTPKLLKATQFLFTKVRIRKTNVPDMGTYTSCRQKTTGPFEDDFSGSI